ncbi:MAG: 16S rRNA (adenine(1518)-N(6)/adenine(1519)-N(6))-dimethyltransferase RsmA [Bacteroidales bacterium]|jgi:16S rRNA (adenine1518-N6/adenine1519-N6)-dimethyltransferase|nr:16S rRNA (adenine(1518)-N(6)/adenine(1519)-N(6))-dimethyltransferase RsmA [Bacteroidales bacterium]
MTSPRTLLTAWNLHPKKQLGQHFLSNPSTAEMITARSGIVQEDIVLEIGAGLGALTIPLARTAKKVYAVDTDSQMIELLNTELIANSISNVVLIKKNILEVNIERLAKEAGSKLIVIGNLPYNISSQILVQLIKSRNVVSRSIFMLQKELSRRIIAKPCCRDYGRLSVILQYCADVRKIADIKAHQFFPKPKVDSEVLEIKFKTAIKCPAKDEVFFFKIIKAAFGQRRKTLRNALAGSELHLDTSAAQRVLESAGIEPSRRAETLTVSEFVELSHWMN